jgi:hypothetical protein
MPEGTYDPEASFLFLGQTLPPKIVHYDWKPHSYCRVEGTVAGAIILMVVAAYGTEKKL